MANPLRSNVLLILLVLVVSATTGLNHYTTQQNAKVYLDGVKYNNEWQAENAMVQETQYLLATRDRQLDAALAALMNQTSRAEQAEKAAIFLDAAMNNAIVHIQECHKLFEKHGIKPPSLPGQAGQPAPGKKKDKKSGYSTA